MNRGIVLHSMSTLDECVTRDKFLLSSNVDLHGAAKFPNEGEAGGEAAATTPVTATAVFG
jgi:hypothetical protein